jgi:proteasome assembly chaperone (PAC2) family protein
MTDPFTWIERPKLSSPALVVMLNGWIDAGSAAASAMDVLLNESAARTIGVFHGDTFIDYRARRPVMELRDGVNTKMIWPTIEVRLGRDVAGHDVLLLTGHEPDSAWRLFCDATTEIALDLGVRMVVGLGAYPYGAPHTRPSRLSITAGSAELAASLPYLKNSVDVPAGVGAALEQRFTEVGVPAVGLWAQVPHYVANLPYPGAGVALLGGLHEMTGVATEGMALRQEADAHRQRLDALIAQNQEHVAMLQQLEAVYDAEVSSGGTGPPPDLPTGDEIAAELERYLRDQGS